MLSQINLSEQCAIYRLRTENTLNQVLSVSNSFSDRLVQAMRYTMLGGGKRLRPILVYATGECFGQSLENLDLIAASVECIHGYSLIHDDLPVMDNDNLRRGKPTCHIAFDESTAILAGDALLTMAFQIMSDTRLMPHTNPSVILRAINEVAYAVGVFGTIGGQIVDIQSTGKNLDIPTLEYIHTHKTGEMILSAVRAGAILSGCEEDELNALTHYAENIGLAFQVMDDILDVEGESEVMGKTAGSDERMKKVTYPAVFGLAESKKIAGRLIDNSIKSLEMFGDKAEVLKDVSEYIIARKF